MAPIGRMLRQPTLALAIASTFFFLVSPGPIAAEEFTVDTTADDGAGRLRQEILDQNLENEQNFIVRLAHALRLRIATHW